MCHRMFQSRKHVKNRSQYIAYVKLTLRVPLLFEVIVITRSIAVKMKLAEPLQLY